MSPQNPDRTVDRDLQVFRTLEVGPVKLEPHRLIAPYRLTWKGGQDQTELIYRFQEEVFDPQEELSYNLASMMAAQVAINYGLFCRRIVFRGSYDEVDRRFIRDMSENTAREIYVKKLLQHNPLLAQGGAPRVAVKRPRYLAAKLEFPRSARPARRPIWRLWSGDRSRHAVLSSGGKDSLLSYGVMNEIGQEVHPIFINESGRHWFTALNAYRYFQRHVPHTARVWVNCDRVFNWMLRHMPFVRQNFASIRSDEYPIRLWTVAVFLFGALPLVRKRGLGRLIIGDEFDTTRRLSYRSIGHYDGLYDQSRYFDNALSRYYLRKGWNISQFSVIRPLSELLIEKILVERYPRLQGQQMSCHAAHKKGRRIHPCGRCEKCRRIVGMLSALGADPRRCGYTGQQISSCLDALTREKVHQESAGVEHMMYLLHKRGAIQVPKDLERTIREHPDVLKARFDPERSPLDGIPTDLRQPLLRIFRRHTGGAVRREGRSWKAFNPLQDPALRSPYAFETEKTRMRTQRSERKKSAPVEGYRWNELTWPEAEKRFQEVDTALLPVGSIEQHGPHLPLGTDAFDAAYLADRIAEACSDPKPLVLPLIWYGVSYEHDEFKGTISISNDALSHMVYEIGMNAARNGIKKLVIINGHSGNTPALSFAAQMITRDARIFACVDTGETSDVDVYAIIETPNDIHAGEIETSTSLAVRPQLVKMELAAKRIPKFSSRYLNFTSRRNIPWYVYTKRISQNGVIGDPTKASAKKGEKIWQIMIAHLVALVEDLKDMTLEEIYQRKY
jgi:creatinine amidohydrolase/Fe(II)-dependent formamide hydrolase-like protein/7-cyano-7-deazaguanine synthase in queuosine biosynthesis